jgi:hypothetical protein
MIEVAALFCTLLVTNTSDDGSGSLRAAIDQANSQRYANCQIRFEIPGDEGAQTIRLQRPLPLILYATIDGTTQRDTNPLGPDVELNGSALAEGDGVHICAGSVKGLAINGFPSNGITAGGTGCPNFPFGGLIEKNYVGTDPSGRTAVPNTRGIWVDAWNPSIPTDWEVARNVVSGNRYSGVYVAGGPHRVRHNVIGLTAQRDAGLGNGSSGVAIMRGGSGTDVDDNYIGFNGHFGIGLAPAAHSVAIHGNSFQANHQLAVDYGFDGPSPAGRGDSYTGVPAVPVLTNVRFADGATIVEGTTPNCLGSDATVTLYANDVPDPSGFGEGQYWLRAVRAEGPFTIRYAGDLRGKWVAATFTCGYYYGFPLRSNSDVYAYSITTSEFSRAVEVR